MASRSRTQARLGDHVTHLVQCRRCPRMQSTPVSGGAVVSDVILIGQAPGRREPFLQRPFAHTAGRTLFHWFEQFCEMDETAVRSTIYFAAVCRCFPGKTPAGGDRVPDPVEVATCSRWFNAEIEMLRPALGLPIGKLAIQQFLAPAPLAEMVGRVFRVERNGHAFDLIPLPHPSGA